MHGTHICTHVRRCADNRSRLAKSKSGLEFKLRLQQFIELVRAGPAQRAAAIAHARAHLAPWVTGTAATAPQQQQQHLLELQRAVATLAFPAAARERVPAYRALFQEVRGAAAAVRGGGLLGASWTRTK